MTNSKKESLELIKNMSFCVFDLETTGGNHKHDKIIEIGLIKIENLKIIKEATYLINPEMKIPEFIQKLTNISQNDVSSSDKIEDVIDEVVEFMGNSILVAHNTSFDVPFLNSVLRRLKRPELQNKSICTNLMTKYLIPDILNSNMNYMSRIFSIKHKKAHRALDDAKASADLLLKYLEIFIEKGIQKVNHLYYPRNRFELDRAHYKKTDDHDYIVEKVSQIKTSALITIKGENGLILFSLPIRNGKKESQFISEYMKKTDWQTLTIRLFGPFIEALVNFNNLFTKIDLTIRNEIIKHLWLQHLPGQKSQFKHIDELLSEPIISKDFGDFIILDHLIPDQMVIYPLKSLHKKSQLIFRYPSHHKKLIQYINSKHNKIKSGKIKSFHYHAALKEFVEQVIKKEKLNGTIFAFDHNIALKKTEEFTKELDNFSIQHKPTYDYPREYI